MGSVSFKMKSLIVVLFLCLAISIPADAARARPKYKKYGIQIIQQRVTGRRARKISDDLLGGSEYQCWKTMKEAGVDIVNFPFNTAHRIHSLTLQDLRHYFDPEAPVENGIPTINVDLRSENPILNNTRDSSSIFMSPNLRGLDSVFTHMTNLHYGVAKGTIEDEHLPLVLNRIIHHAHMQDMWSIMQPVFKDLVKNPPSDPALCPCVKDAQKNGVIDELHDMIRDKGSALIGDPDVEYEEGEVEVFNSKSIQDYWMDVERKELVGAYDDEVKVDTYGAALFLYCKLRE